MGTAVARYKPPVKKTEKPKAQTWKARLCRPWTSFCDTRAVAAMASHLHLTEKRPWLELDDFIECAGGGDFGCLPYLRRADIVEAFADRNDAASLVPILVNYLVTEGVLIAEWEPDGDVYRLNVELVYELDAFHAAVDRGKSKGANLHVVT